jgi:hypothetical protein
MSVCRRLFALPHYTCVKATADMEARLQALELAEQERVRQAAAAAEVVRVRAGEERRGS